MKRHALIYGLVGGLLITVLKWSEYRFLVLEHSLEIYGGLVAAVFASVGIWLGLKLIRPRERVVIKEVPTPAAAFTLNTMKQEQLAITNRELEILQLIAEGLSNREIAERLFVSENTVKTHSSRLFDKLGSLLRTVVDKARIELAQHISELVLTPKQTEAGPVYEVTGDWKLLPEKKCVIWLVARDGIEPPTPAFSGPRSTS